MWRKKYLLDKALVENLTPDLLQKGQTGHCYIASEAYHHIKGGKDSGLKPMNMRHEGASHWFLLDGDRVIDLTAYQFNTPPDYSKARGRGFLTREPSRRAQILMRRVTQQKVPHTINEWYDDWFSWWCKMTPHSESYYTKKWHILLPYRQPMSPFYDELSDSIEVD